MWTLCYVRALYIYCGFRKFSTLFQILLVCTVSCMWQSDRKITNTEFRKKIMFRAVVLNWEIRTQKLVADVIFMVEVTL